MSSVPYTILEDANEVLHAENKLIDLFSIWTNPKRKYQNCPPHDIWYRLNRPSKKTSKKYENLFGIIKGDDSYRTVSCINIPKEGINSKMGGLFLKDQQGVLFLAHHGWNRGGNTNITNLRAKLHKLYPTQFAKWDEDEYGVFIIGKLDSSLPKKIGQYIHDVAKIKF